MIVLPVFAVTLLLSVLSAAVLFLVGEYHSG
jgi:hypothetical protein